MKTLLNAIMIFFVFCGYAFCGGYDTVAVISIDALHPDAVQRKYASNIFSLIDGGYYSPLAKSSNPPKTLIAHTAMLTGLSPEKNGKTDNDWKPGEPVTDKDTLFNSAKMRGFSTVYVYSKKKLGYLGGPAADKEIFSAEDAVDKASGLIESGRKQFIFLHISGLDTEGPISGWLSPEYIDEFSFIDEELGGFFIKIKQKGSALIIVTSDHAGHEKIHGSDNPQDYKRPLVVWSSYGKQDVPESALSIDGLRSFIESQIDAAAVRK